MPIKARCSECGRVYKLGDDRAGQSLECKDCGATFEVPDALRAVPRNEDDRDRLRPKRRDSKDREDERPTEKTAGAKKSGSLMPWLLVGGGAVLLLMLLCGGGAVVVVLAMRDDNKPVV